MDYIALARTGGLPQKTIHRQALRAAPLNVVTIVRVLFSFTIGIAILVEIFFG